MGRLSFSFVHPAPFFATASPNSMAPGSTSSSARGEVVVVYLIDSGSEPESSSRSGKGEKEVIEINSSDEDEPEPKDDAAKPRDAVESNSASSSMDLVRRHGPRRQRRGRMGVDEMEVDEVSS